MARPITLRELKPLDLGSLSSDRAVCISDIHLPEQSMEVSGDLAAFIRDLDASHLFLLGDIFDFWLGAKHNRVATYGTVISALKQCARRGVRVVALRGNRDFLAQDYLRREVGAAAAGDAVTFTAGGKRVLLTHGDAVCVWDSRYAAWRRICCTSSFAEAAGALPLSAARFIARMARLGSSLEVRFKPVCSIEVFESALSALYRDGIDIVAAGHIHNVGQRTRTVDGRQRTLFVLGGWENGGCHLDIENGTFHLRDWKEGNRKGKRG